jgi:hypothetical protein
MLCREIETSLRNRLGRHPGRRRCAEALLSLHLLDQAVEHFGAKAFGNAGDEKKRTGHHGQIQRRMLAMMAICASQPAVKASVRAAGIAAE